MMRISSVNVGLPREILWEGQPVKTGIFKQPVSGPVRVLAKHLEGDGQADLRVHGGPDKSVYAYALEHYDYWRDIVPADRCCLWGEPDHQRLVGNAGLHR
ncbi:MOSC domain-containing protein [Hymenobacter negativus]|uniref:MOSC domain-containing protein n=1 Tax=Hymenobacter negativus TaxID=2795026 RepID=A0ABS3QGG1_9BACT|nr:MOSC domain-containing protein [Hymenobacter negativus]MBO2010073.1 hypothetical protein [Hymenobacter negativus]